MEKKTQKGDAKQRTYLTTAQDDVKTTLFVVYDPVLDMYVAVERSDERYQNYLQEKLRHYGYK